MAKVSFDKRASRTWLAVADRLLAGLVGVCARKSNPRDASTVPNYFVAVVEDQDLDVLNLCLWDSCVGLQFRHPDCLPPEVFEDPEVRLYKGMRWPEYRYRDSDAEHSKALRMTTRYLEVVRPAVVAGLLRKSGSSKAERLLRKRVAALFPHETISWNDRSLPWLQNLELDIVLPNLGVAIEVQGAQHFEPVWGVDNLERVRRNDEAKRQRCIRNEMSLIRVKERDSMDMSDTEIEAAVRTAAEKRPVLLDLY